MTQCFKYLKTFHLPFSPGLQNDDRRLPDEHCFDGKTSVISIKMDGENTSCYRDAIHARSLYAMTHYSQHYMKGLWAAFRYQIPKNWRVCGENLYARHSIPYLDLPSFFMVFNVWDAGNNCLPFDDTIEFCNKIGLHHVPVIGFTNIINANWDVVKQQFELAINRGQEGIVIRNIESFHYDDFQSNVAKAVRKNHVQTDVHWTKTWVPNKLKEN